jgi:hypothetical protein
LFGSVDICFLQNLRTPRANFSGAEVDLLVVRPHVFVRFDDSRSSPTCNSELRIFLTEPGTQRTGITSSNNNSGPVGHIFVHF